MIKEKAFAKINIGLDIVRKRPDGYHDIDTVMQSVALHDTVIFEKHPGIVLDCNVPGIPIDGTNTAHKAALSFFRHAGLDPAIHGVRITIEKNIPAQAGLGGGSSDAAAVLRGLNKLYCTNYSTEVLRKLALEVGSDVPFCVEGGTQRAGGRGEKLEPLKPFTGFPVVIIMPDATVSTTRAYSLYGKTDNPIHPDMDAVCGYIKRHDLNALGKTTANTFEGLIFPENPKIQEAARDILETGAAVTLMTGSGAAVFGIYQDAAKAEKSYGQIKDKYRAFITETIGGTL